MYYLIGILNQLNSCAMYKPYLKKHRTDLRHQKVKSISVWISLSLNNQSEVGVKSNNEIWSVLYFYLLSNTWYF